MRTASEMEQIRHTGSMNEPEYTETEAAETEVSMKDMYRELRYKFLMIMKSQFWEFFEEGLCQQDTVIILQEAADVSIDDAKKEINIWKFLQDYCI